MGKKNYDKNYFRCHRFDSVTGELKKVMIYKELSKCLLYAKRSLDDVSIRDSNENILFAFEMGKLCATYEPE